MLITLLLASLPAVSSPIKPYIVTGFSSGASAAVNHLVAFPDEVHGIGIVGGSPYGCNTVPDCGNTYVTAV